MAKTRTVEKNNLSNTAPTIAPTLSTVQDVRNTFFGVVEKRWQVESQKGSFKNLSPT